MRLSIREALLASVKDAFSIQLLCFISNLINRLQLDESEEYYDELIAVLRKALQNKGLSNREYGVIDGLEELKQKAKEKRQDQERKLVCSSAS